jgi:hypothetical protein
MKILGILFLNAVFGFAEKLKFKIIKCNVPNDYAYTKISSLLENEYLGIELWDRKDENNVYLKVPSDSFQDTLVGLTGIEYDIFINDLKIFKDNHQDEMLQETFLTKRDSTMNHTIYDDAIFGSYQNYASIMNYLLEKPDALEIQIGKTYNETPIRGVKVGSGSKIVVVTGGMHGTCRLTSSTATYLASYLMSNSSTAASVRERFTIHIIPVLNPDGYEYAMNENVRWYKNRQPSSDQSCVGTDLQLNFEFQFGNDIFSEYKKPCNPIYIGQHAFSANESAALEQYMTSLGNIEAYIDLACAESSFGGRQTFFLPFLWTRDLPTDFDDMIGAVANAITTIEGINGRSYEYERRVQTMLDKTRGGYFLDYIYAVQKVKYPVSIGLTANGVNQPYPDVEEIRPTGEEISEGILAFLDYVYENGGPSKYVIPNNTILIIVLTSVGVALLGSGVGFYWYRKNRY